MVVTSGRCRYILIIINPKSLIEEKTSQEIRQEKIASVFSVSLYFSFRILLNIANRQKKNEVHCVIPCLKFTLDSNLQHSEI